MRPVEKKKPGDTVVYKTSMDQTVTHTIKTEYKPYSTAKAPLIANIGEYCSYCEEPRSQSDIHIEHIKPKSKDGAIFEWDNFLLACSMCNNCKSNAEVNLEETHFPHLDNTYLDFIYDESGRIKINPNLSAKEYKRAENLYNLLKMGRNPYGEEATSERDFRWKNRYETWHVAKRYISLYSSGNIELKDILELAKSYGHWSIWFTLAKGHDELRKALIEHTPGTCKDCFDANNHYEPVPRTSSTD